MSAQNPASLPASMDASPEPAPVDPAPLNGPHAANLGDGAIGRLSEAEGRMVLRHMSPMAPGQALADLLADVERIVREHTERALADVEQRIASWIRHGEAVPADVTTYDRWIVHEELRAIVRAARQEQDR